MESSFQEYSINYNDTHSKKKCQSEKNGSILQQKGLFKRGKGFGVPFIPEINMPKNINETVVGFSKIATY